MEKILFTQTTFFGQQTRRFIQSFFENHFNVKKWCAQTYQDKTTKDGRICVLKGQELVFFIKENTIHYTKVGSRTHKKLIENGKQFSMVDPYRVLFRK